MRKLRNAFIVNGFPVPLEPFIATQAAALVAAGHDVQIFGMFPNNAPSSSASEHIQTLLDSRYHNVSWPVPIDVTP